jgi:hypothetical protein
MVAAAMAGIDRGLFQRMLKVDAPEEDWIWGRGTAMTGTMRRAG